MATPKVVVNLKREMYTGDTWFRVLKVTNALAPNISESLSADQVQTLINAGVTVNIT